MLTNDIHLISPVKVPRGGVMGHIARVINYTNCNEEKGASKVAGSDVTTRFIIPHC